MKQGLRKIAFGFLNLVSVPLLPANGWCANEPFHCDYNNQPAGNCMELIRAEVKAHRIRGEISLRNCAGAFCPHPPLVRVSLIAGSYD
jgi:hypothetical protein